MPVAALPRRGQLEPADDLRALMAEHRLTQRDVAGLACVSIKTVEGWLADKAAASWRNMHPRHLHCVRLALPGFLKLRASKKGR